MPEPAIETRANLRLHHELTGELSIAGGPGIPVTTKDVSLTGAWIDYAARQKEVRRQCLLTLFIEKDGVLQTAVFRCQIVRRGFTGCGLQFLAVDDQDFQIYTQELCDVAPEARAILSEFQQGFVPYAEDWSIA